MLESIPTIISTTKTLYELSKTLKEAKDEFEKEQALLDLHRKISSLQQEMISLKEEHIALLDFKCEAIKEGFQLTKDESWKDNYSLHETTSGVMVYISKPQPDPPTPVHHICPNCYENGIKSILQPDNSAMQFIKHDFICPKCDEFF